MSPRGRKDADPQNAKLAKRLRKAAEEKDQEDASKARARAAFAGWRAAKRLLRGR